MSDILVNNDSELLCPHCKGNYGHISEVEKINCEYGIGCRIIIECENGHFWRLRIIPFKGNLMFLPEGNDDYPNSKSLIKRPGSFEWR